MNRFFVFLTIYVTGKNLVKLTFSVMNYYILTDFYDCCRLTIFYLEKNLTKMNQIEIPQIL